MGRRLRGLIGLDGAPPSYRHVFAMEFKCRDSLSIVASLSLGANFSRETCTVIGQGGSEPRARDVIVDTRNRARVWREHQNFTLTNNVRRAVPRSDDALNGHASPDKDPINVTLRNVEM